MEDSFNGRIYSVGPWKFKEEYKFEALFNVSNKKQLIKICKFINTIIERVSSLC